MLIVLYDSLVQGTIAVNKGRVVSSWLCMEKVEMIEGWDSIAIPEIPTLNKSKMAATKSTEYLLN